MDEEKPTSPSVPRPRTGELRDWINAIVAICALIVSVVSLWTTTQVSGVQDYLQSEIRRRNNELNGISSRSNRLEEVASERSERLAALQVATDAVLASAFEAQRSLASAQGDLAKVRSEATSAKVDLASAKSSAVSLEAKMNAQSDAFDLFARKKAVELLSFPIMIETLFGDDKEISGKKTLSDIQKLDLPESGDILKPYIQRVKARIGLVCPSLPDWKADLPHSLQYPAAPTITYLSNANRETIDRLTREAQAKYTSDVEKYHDNQRALTDARIKAFNTVTDMARDCTCMALADEKFAATDICERPKSGGTK